MGARKLAAYFVLHPVTPQLRLIRRAAEIVREGGVIAYPTDSCYALGWHMGDTEALERVRRIRKADKHHHFTLMCSSLAEVGHFAKLDTWQFRMLKTVFPGPYTFLLPATRETPRRLQHERKRTIGVRIPDHPVPQMLLAELGEPMMSTTLILPDSVAEGEVPQPLTDGEQIKARLEPEIDAILDGGNCGFTPTTVVDLSVSPPQLTRRGKGDLSLVLGKGAEGADATAL
jgi:tRNA threonylcarbamoyl adenosine modification protein (Sua5/YciO/YrdC/YwlC family)